VDHLHVLVRRRRPGVGQLEDLGQDLVLETKLVEQFGALLLILDHRAGNFAAAVHQFADRFMVGRATRGLAFFETHLFHSFLVVLPIVPVNPHESRADHLTSDYKKKRRARRPGESQRTKSTGGDVHESAHDKK
jgi:hypothetical protein